MYYALLRGLVDWHLIRSLCKCLLGGYMLFVSLFHLAWCMVFVCTAGNGINLKVSGLDPNEQMEIQVASLQYMT